VSGRAVVPALSEVGFAEVSQRGSHLKLRDPTGKTVIVPLHRELARGTLRSILRQADLTVEAFVELL
jgi:predicted RNA binding protein YcfA (HicA-like mRNA interferase family)